jgi:hypothetical protein
LQREEFGDRHGRRRSLHLAEQVGAVAKLGDNVDLQAMVPAPPAPDLPDERQTLRGPRSELDAGERHPRERRSTCSPPDPAAPTPARRRSDRRSRGRCGNESLSGTGT